MSQHPKVNYVIAAWGEGRTTPGVSPHECLGYLRAHKTLLEELKHNLSQVTVVHPYSSNLIQEYKDFLKNLENLKLGAVCVKVLYRPNENLSYGSWSHAFDIDRENFDYYIFLEDDYVPCCDNFDSILVDIIERKKADYVCSMISTTTWNNNGIPHAGVTVGICRSSAMQKIWNIYGSLLYNGETHCYEYWVNQLRFSYVYNFLGLKIVDYADEYGVPFWYAQQSDIIRFVDRGNKNILVPIQYYRTHFKNV